jgi:hypothetical protein
MKQRGMKEDFEFIEKWFLWLSVATRSNPLGKIEKIEI